MACCILTAVLMNQLIKICDIFDVRFFQIKYNDDDDHERDLYARFSASDKGTSAICHINVTGMTCSACSLTITEQLEAIHGVHRAGVSLALARATVSYDALATTPAALLEIVENAGYCATLEDIGAQGMIERLNQSQELHDLRQAISSASVFSTVIASLEYLAHLNGITSYIPHVFMWIVFSLAVKIQVADARLIHMRAWSRGKRKMTMENLLSLSLALGLGLAMLQGIFGQEQSSIAYSSSCSFLTIVFLAGRYLEGVLKRESHCNLVALCELQAERKEYEIVHSKAAMPTSLLRKGDDIVIRPQSNIPCDCFVLKGTSVIDESTITGESMPVVKTVGDFLFAGTRNLSNQIQVMIAQDQSTSSLAKVIEGVLTATEQRLDGMETLEAVMSYFVSGVMCLAVATLAATFWRLRSQAFATAFVIACEKLATVLAAACPCGIGLAIPSAAMAGIDVAYSKGILLGGGIRTMQTLTKITHVVMDKTGTLTQGCLEVVHHHFSEDLKLEPQLCYRLLAAAEFEEARVHPVAKSVFKWALSQTQLDKSQQAVAPVRALRRTIGMGISCEVCSPSNEWIPVHIGHASFVSSHNISIPFSQVDQTSESSKVHFAFFNTYAGHLLLHDTLRSEALSVVDTLLQSGLDVTMLTGDTAAEASRISTALGIRVLGSRALPEDKVTHIQQLQKMGHHVAMVGDGINDAPAQLAADIGISISLAQGCLTGSGGVAIISKDLDALAVLFRISRMVVRQAKINVLWALVYNVIGLSLAVGMWECWAWRVGPKEAGMMMAGSSVSVLSLSLWLRSTLSDTASRKS